MEPLTICALGRVPYAETWDLQRDVQARLIAAKRRTPPEMDAPHVLMLVEHPPVYTLGKSGDKAHLLLSEDALAERGAAFFPIDRGGDITYHGPGQLVGYPILDLDRFFTDIHRYLRTLEDVIMATCADYGVAAGRLTGKTGVWIHLDQPGQERKICAMGIRCSRWVTMHGFAFNLNTNLDDFSYIIPCGIPDRGVTSLAEALGHPVDEDAVQQKLVHHFVQAFSAQPTFLQGDDAQQFLTRFIAPASQPA